MAYGDAPAQGRFQQTGLRVDGLAIAPGDSALAVSEAARRAAQCADIFRRAVYEGERIAQSFTCLAEAVERIGDVVRLINGITDQTNLPALRTAIATASPAAPDDEARRVRAREHER